MIESDQTTGNNGTADPRQRPIYFQSSFVPFGYRDHAQYNKSGSRHTTIALSHANLTLRRREWGERRTSEPMAMTPRSQGRWVRRDGRRHSPECVTHSPSFDTLQSPAEIARWF